MALKQTVSDFIAKQLLAMNVECVFGLLSDDTIPLVAAVEGAGIEFCALRHENNSVLAAEGYSSATGKLGVAIIGRGPATANALNGIVHASRSSSRVLIIAGDSDSSGAEHPDYKRLDVLRVMEAAGVSAYAPENTGSFPLTWLKALDSALQGAATLHLSKSMQLAALPSDAAADFSRQRNHAWTAGDLPAASLQEANEIISNARRPLILAGLGAHQAGARNVLVELANKIGAALGTTLKAKGLFYGEPYALGVVGGMSHGAARRLVDQADCVLVFGASLNDYTMSFGTALPNVPVIHVDAYGESINRHYPVQLGIKGDARVVAEQLLKELPERPQQEKHFHAAENLALLATYERRREFEAANTNRTLDPRWFSLEMDAILPDARNVIFDLGNFMMAASYLTVKGPRNIKLTNDFFSIGNGLGTAIGFARGRRGETNVLFVGDGGLFMSLSELESVARNDIPLIIIVMNDCAYGAELHVCRALGYSDAGTRFPDVDFAELAKPFGFRTATLRTVDSVQAVEDLLRAPEDGPILIDCKINAEVAAPFMAELMEARGA